MFMILNLSTCEPDPFKKNVSLRLLYVDLKVFHINSNVKILNCRSTRPIVYCDIFERLIEKPCMSFLTQPNLGQD